MTGRSEDRVGLEFISVLGLNPVRFVEVAAKLGCRFIGLGLEPIVTCSTVDAGWSLRTDPALRKDMIAALAANGVTISVGEGFVAMPHEDITVGAKPDLEKLAELGAGRVNFLSVDHDPARALDQCARFVELAASFGMVTTIEFLPGLPLIDSLPSALALVQQIGRPDFGVLLDAMHVFRSGSDVADVAALDPAVVGYVQLCDVPLVSPFADYADEARFERLSPGDGELPLQRFVEALPSDTIIGLELPMRGKAEAGVDAVERLAPAVERTRRMLDEARRA